MDEYEIDPIGDAHRLKIEVGKLRVLKEMLDLAQTIEAHEFPPDEVTGPSDIQEIIDWLTSPKMVARIAFSKTSISEESVLVMQEYEAKHLGTVNHYWSLARRLAMPQMLELTR